MLTLFQGVSVERWNGRAVRGALVRLEQTRYLERFTVEKAYKDPRLKKNILICIRRLREPEEDDIRNLKFKRIATESNAVNPVEEEPLEDDTAGDELMRDLELDMTTDAGYDEEEDDLDTSGQVPPQWTPDRLLANMVVDAVDMAGVDGIDTARLRDLTTGFFWKRPLESLVTRLTEDWYFNQPLPTRHLAIVRDTTMANDTKRVHYAYRTHQNFQKAVDAGEVTWEALQLEKGKKPKQAPPPASSVDAAGFSTINSNEFHKRTGSSTLSEANGAIVRKHRQTRDWESILLSGGADYQAALTPRRGPTLKSRTPRRSGTELEGKKEPKTPRPLLTQAERLVLGLPAKGRLGAEYEAQIRAHRKKTGDPNSIPKTLVKGSRVEKSQQRTKSRPKLAKGILNGPGRDKSPTRMNALVDNANSEDGSELAGVTPLHNNEERAQEGRDSGTYIPASIDESPKESEIPMALDNSDSQTPVPSPTKHIAAKRTMLESDAQAGTTNKRARKSSVQCTPEEVSTHLYTATYTDGSAEDVTGVTRESNGEIPASSIHTPVEVANVSDSMKTSEERATLRTSKNPLVDAQEYAQACKTLYRERIQPGLYINPSATRPANGRRGRPRKMFLATFRSQKIHDLPWFVSESIDHGETNDISTARKEALPERDFSMQNDESGPLASPVADNFAKTVSTQAPRNSIEHPLIDVEPETEIHIASNDLQPECVVDTRDNQQTKTVPASMTPISEQVDLQRPTDSVPSTEMPSSSTSRQLPGMDIVEHRDVSLYQSPYGPPPSPPPLPTSTSTMAHQTTATAEDSSNMKNSKDTPSIVSKDISKPSRYAKASKRKYDRSVRVGGGSVTHTRINIIKHVLDLCDGVIPGMDVIYNVFPAVWSELGPKKIACPIDGTIRDAIHAMCPSELSKGTFIVPRVDVPGRKTKTIWFRSCYQFTSPEVQRVVNEIVQALPRKYCPPRLRKYWKEEEKSFPVLPKVNNSYSAELYPPTLRKLDDRIIQARRDRHKAIKAAKEEERRLAKQAKKEAKRLAKERKQQEKLNTSGSRQRSFKARQRLVGLNDTADGGDGYTVPREVLGFNDRNPASIIVDQSLPSQRSREDSPASVSSADEPLINIRPHPLKAIEGPMNTTSTNLKGAAPTRSAAIPAGLIYHTTALLAPTMRLHLSTHTISTDFKGHTPGNEKKVKKMGRKRVRIEVQEDQVSRKRVRTLETCKQTQSAENHDDFLARHHIDIRESSDDEEEDEKENDTGPTIAQRLAGLTGDPDQPDYEQTGRKKSSAWSIARDKRRRDRKRRSFNAVNDEKMKKSPETFDPPGDFRKLCYTLAIASSMGGDDGSVDWSIVSKVYGDAPRFNLAKTKRIWIWMQKNMNERLRMLVDSFQSHFLTAYEEGRVEPIEDPRTYDWSRLVRWALSTCTDPELSLPITRELLDDFQFDLLSYNILDRKVWHNTTLANVGRDERLAKYSFGGPLHRKPSQSTQGDDVVVKARSLIRVTISTPKALYDKTVAHDRLKTVPEHLINRTVHDFLQASVIKERKVKRQVPGRNYLFASQFAKHYRRTFDLSDFMVAVQLKKELDAAFLNSDPSKRAYYVSRMAEDGIVMPLISLASEGKIKLVPKLPPIKNEFNAALPRISVWGFSEGDYRHRHMDRRRLFWPIEVVPTAAYQFGNPLRPTQCSADSTENITSVEWKSLPEPPLPCGEENPSPLLPIWSTIDGKTVVYPWWNRILNIVVQSLLFSPGMTSQDILARCEPYTTENFEIQLVLDWLVTIKAAERSSHSTYEVLPGYWAVFGDKLIGEDTDEFGEHVRRQKKNMKFGTTWRTEYNREYNRTTEGGQKDNGATNAGQEVFNNPGKQYSIAKHVTAGTASSAPMNITQQLVEAARMGDGEGDEAEEPADKPTSASTPTGDSSSGTQDVEMTDLDAEGEDMDAEGESDDDFA